jgi:hypothetical protein
MITYLDALNDALDRLKDLGYEMESFPGSGVPAFAMHGPMAAEALASLGHCDELADWVEEYKKWHRHFTAPAATTAIDGNDEKSWRAAMGDFKRVTDWKIFFLAEIKNSPWQATLTKWCPRLVPGMMGALTHGLIRTMHAVRSLSVAEHASDLQLDELARGLAYWASRYTPLPVSNSNSRAAAQLLSDPAEVPQALSNLIKEHAQLFITVRDTVVPLVHTMTPLNGLRILLPYIPACEHPAMYEFAKATTDAIGSRFSSSNKLREAQETELDRLPTMDNLARNAAAHGAEHVIKLAAALQIEHGIAPHDVMLKAVKHVIDNVPRPETRTSMAQTRRAS